MNFTDIRMSAKSRHKARVIRSDADIESIPVLVEPPEDQPTGGSEPDPQVRIVHDGEQGATIEVVCSCGRKITIQCEYEARKVEVDHEQQ